MPYKPLANLLIAAFLLLLSMVAVTQGSVPIAAGQLWQSLKLLATAASETEYAMAHRIIIELRLPRVLLAGFVGLLITWRHRLRTEVVAGSGVGGATRD